jgi:hypothetical protein
MTNITLQRQLRTITTTLILTIATISIQATPSSASPRRQSAQDVATQIVVKSPMVGRFITQEKSTTGTARIVQENGHNYLEFDADFSTNDQGPDLHVLLDQSSQAPQSYNAKASHRYVNLGKIEKFSGRQRYPIPDGVNIANYKSAVIWCRMANATFGYAPLN